MSRAQNLSLFQGTKGPDPQGDGPSIECFLKWLKDKRVKVEYKDIKYVYFSFKDDKAREFYEKNKKVIEWYETNKDVIDDFVKLKGKEKPNKKNSDIINFYKENKGVINQYLKNKPIEHVVYPHKLLAGEKNLDITDRETIIDQAIGLIDHVYVHLPLKKAMHAVDPVQRLKLLRYRNSKLDEDDKDENGQPKPKLDDRTFHKEMISIFTELRDLHTTYILPGEEKQEDLKTKNFKFKIAFLPFLIEEFYDEDERKKKYMVSKVFNRDMWENHPTFQQGVIITHWNGTPIEEAVRLNGEGNAGSNEDARHARGLERLTIRPLKTCLPPEEEWVDITYKNVNNGKKDVVKFNWYVADYRKLEKEMNYRPDRAEDRAAIGIDYETEIARATKQKLFAKKEDTVEVCDDHPLQPFTRPSDEWRDVFAYSKTRDDKYGYIRIYTFLKDPDDFVEKFRSIRKSLPQKGLIIDVRGNGGGIIPAGEKLLQVLKKLSPIADNKKLECACFQFINTPLTLQLCSNGSKPLEQWKGSIDSSIETGAIYSQGFPLVKREELEKTSYSSDKEEKRYEKGIILITDALCYSTTDIFAAGFKDNNIGTILGLHKKTGAGGANVWCYSDLSRELASGLFNPLPKGVDFTVAVRRATRVGEKIGMPLEDLGVEADYTYEMKKEDLLDHNKDLIQKAVDILEDSKNWEKQDTTEGGKAVEMSQQKS